jgi:hypothetical protein
LPPHHGPPSDADDLQPPESRFVGLLKPFFDSIDPDQTSRCFSLGAKIKNYDEAVLPEHWYF